MNLIDIILSEKKQNPYNFTYIKFLSWVILIYSDRHQNNASGMQVGGCSDLNGT